MDKRTLLHKQILELVAHMNDKPIPPLEDQDSYGRWLGGMVLDSDAVRNKIGELCSLLYTLPTYKGY